VTGKRLLDRHRSGRLSRPVRVRSTMAGALRGIPAVMVAEEWAGSFRRRTLERGRDFFRQILLLIYKLFFAAWEKLFCCL